MDFLKLLRSFEDLVFEAATWLLFYPRTFLWIIARPLQAAAYSDAEQGVEEDRRYDDALSPPLLLLFTVVLANLIALALHVPQLHEKTDLGKALLDSPQSLVLLRALIFSLVPLVSAATLVRRLRLTLSRANLRPAFYAQCYMAAPLAMAASVGATILRRDEIPNAIGAVILSAGTLWFITVESRWFAARLSIGIVEAFGLAVWAIVQALAYFALVVVVVAVL